MESFQLKPISEVHGTTITNTITSLPSIPNGAVRAIVQVDTAAVRARFDATTSMSGGVGYGLLLSVSTHYTLDGYDTLNRMRMFRDTATDAKINVIYFGQEQPGVTS